MRSKVWTVPYSAVALVGVLCVAVVSFAEPKAETKNESSTVKKSDSTKEKPKKKRKSKQAKEDEKRVSVPVARERAKLAHSIYSATLDVIHHHYFRKDKSAIPARAMEDVFSEIAWRENIKANWISVNTRAMSIDHRPEGKFEKQAAKAIAAGKRDYERVENGVYRRAQGISLMNRGCLGCHLGFGATAKTDRFAGLVISIPVIKK